VTDVIGDLRDELFRLGVTYPTVPRADEITVTDLVVFAEPARVQFELNEAVRLLNRHGDVPSGSLGRIIGCLPGRALPVYVVSFLAETVCVRDVRSDEIVPAHQLRAST